MTDFFKDKTKRIAHTSKFLEHGSNGSWTPWTSKTSVDFDKYKKVSGSGSEKRQNIEDDNNYEKVGGPKRIASGTVTIGTVLSDFKLRKIMKEATVAQNMDMMKLTMILRERDGSFTYDEALLIDRYYEKAKHDFEESISLQRREKLKRINDRKSTILEKSDLEQSTLEALSDDLEFKSIPIPIPKPSTSLNLPCLEHAGEKSLGFDRENNGHSPVPVPVWQYLYPTTHAGGHAKGGSEASCSDSFSYWANYLQSAENIRQVAPVEYFKQAPLADIWKSFALTGVFIEVENPYVDENNTDKAFWIGEIAHYAGYLALVEFVSFDTSPDAPLYLAWINFASDAPKPLDWCHKEGITLDSGHIVPASVKNQKMFSTKLINFYEQGRYRKNTIGSNHLQVISDNYYKSSKSGCRHRTDPDPDVQRMFEPQNSDSVCTRLARSLPQAATGIFAQYKLHSNNTNISTDDIITTDTQKVQFKISVGMLLETRHPLLRHKIVGAVVTHVLRESFFVETREKARETRVSFLYHLASPFIFPWGWGAKFGIQVDFDRTFDSDLVLRSEELPKRETHKFVPGLKLEALDEFNPQIGYPATIQKVADHLLLIRIVNDNTEWAHQNQDLWADVESSAIFPVGYCHSAGLKFLRG